MKTHRLRLMFAACLSAVAVAAAEPPPTEPADRALKILQTQPIRFPARMMREGILRGEVKVAFHVDREGRLVDWLVVAFTHRPFAEVTADALRRWKFVPQRADGRNVASIVSLTVRFENNGVVALERVQPPDIDSADVPLAGEFTYQPCAPRELDRPLRLETVVPPDYPRSLRSQGIGGSVTADFYVDETGRTRMVVASAGTHPTLESLAIAAVEQWRFAPPTRRGDPVLVHVRQDFTFNPNE